MEAAAQARRKSSKSPVRKATTPTVAPFSVASDAASQSEQDAQPVKRGRGRPRKDGRDPIPRKSLEKQEQKVEDWDMSDVWTSEQRSRSGRKIQRTTFHDEVGGLAFRLRDTKRSRNDEDDDAASGSGAVGSNEESGRRSDQTPRRGVLEDSKPAARISLSSVASYHGFVSPDMTYTPSASYAAASSVSSGKNPRRKPGARECMQISRKFGSNIIDQRYFDILMVSLVSLFASPPWKNLLCF